MESKLTEFWRKNRSILVLLIKWYFLIQTITLIVVSIIFLRLMNYIGALASFSSAFVSGAMTYALFRFHSRTLL